MITEIKNKAFRALMEKEGLKDVHLYRNLEEGYHYVVSDNPNIYFNDTAIYCCKFGDQTIKNWIEDIKQLIVKE